MEIIENYFTQKDIKYYKNKVYVRNSVDNDTLDEFSMFPISSCSMLLTHYIIMQLQQCKKLSYDDPVTKYIDDVQLQNMTIYDLINHTTDLKMYDNYHQNVQFNNIVDSVNIVLQDNIRGNKFELYSNIGYLILGAIIEIVTGKSYNSVLLEYMSQMGLTHTSVEPNYVKCYDEHMNTMGKDDVKFIRWMSSFGGIYSCVNDMVEFAKQLPSFLSDENKAELKCKCMKTDALKLYCGGILRHSTIKYHVDYDDDLKYIDSYIKFNTCV